MRKSNANMMSCMTVSHVGSLKVAKRRFICRRNTVILSTHRQCNMLLSDIIRLLVLLTAITSLPTVHSFRRALKTELFVRSFGSARHRP